VASSMLMVTFFITRISCFPNFVSTKRDLFRH
jgi:hypothetical protein